MFFPIEVGWWVVKRRQGGRVSLTIGQLELHLDLRVAVPEGGGAEKGAEAIRSFRTDALHLSAIA